VTPRHSADGAQLAPSRGAHPLRRGPNAGRTQSTESKDPTMNLQPRILGATLGAVAALAVGGVGLAWAQEAPTTPST
jgi:hypothetical protein